MHPHFNSISIETLVYQIPDLAEHFIYFNDDFFLIKETKQSDFLIKSIQLLGENGQNMTRIDCINQYIKKLSGYLVKRQRIKILVLKEPSKILP